MTVSDADPDRILRSFMSQIGAKKDVRATDNANTVACACRATKDDPNHPTFEYHHIDLIDLWSPVTRGIVAKVGMCPNCKTMYWRPIDENPTKEGPA